MSKGSRCQYTAAAGSLTFEAGEIEMTVEVAVLDDVHDKGNEPLTLAPPIASEVAIADGEATGDDHHLRSTAQGLAFALRSEG